MTRALSISELLKKKYKTLPFEGEWFEAFHQPECVGTWIIWGEGANGKTTFALQLAKELARYGRGIYNSLEQGGNQSMQTSFKRTKMDEVKRQLILVQEPIERLSERLLRPKSPYFAIIDSWQFAGLTYKSYQELKAKHPDKLLIFISHADGKKPEGRGAKRAAYDAEQRIYVEGFRAHSRGRNNDGGVFTIWDKGAKEYYGL